MVGVGLCLRLPLFDRSIWFDEACMSDQRIGTFEQLLATLYVDIHPPLYVTFMHVWNGIFGDGEWSMRTPPLLAGLAIIPLCHWAGHRLVGSNAALWAAALATLSPVLVWYSAEARLYTPMTALTLVLFGTYVRLLDPDGAKEGRRRGLFVLHTLTVFVMLALHYYLAVFVAALAALAPIVGRGFSRGVQRVLVSHGLGLVALAGFVAGKRALGTFETGQDYLRALTFDELFRFVFDWCWTGHTVAAGNTIWHGALGAAHQVLGVMLVVLGLASLVRRRQSLPYGWLVPVGLLALPCFLIAVALLGFGNTYVERSLIAALPFVLLLAGAGITSLDARTARWVGGASLGLAMVALVALYSYLDTRWTVYKPNSDWRSAAAYLASEIETGGAGRLVFTSTPNPRPLSYYDERIQDVKSLSPPTTPERIGAAVTKRLGTTIGTFAERSYRGFVDHNARLLAGARLLVHRSRPAPEDLPRQPEVDSIVYLVRDHWHPHVTVDGSVEALLRHPKVEPLEERRFAGISVYKVRFLP